MRLNLVLLCVLVLLSGCKKDSGIEPGVSRELAVVRGAMLNNINYNLYFDIPKKREQKIRTKSTISFDMVDNGADSRASNGRASSRTDNREPLVLDFKAEREQILSVVVNGEAVPYLFENEHIVIKSKYLKEGGNSVAIEFIAGEISLNRNDEFLYTLLVPDRCRTLMPCFDQPDLKATFELKLKVPKEWKGVGNGVLSKLKESDNCDVYEFEKTKPLSTYLFAFAAGRFEYVSQTSSGRTIGIYHRETDAAKIESSIPAITEQVVYALDWMEQYADMEYPFGHYNVVAIPDFQYGGMEHPGATYYRSSTLFLSPDADLAAQMRRSELISHETAHMWFGDLVTMKWFDDVWLKEVFAGLMADKITAGLFPEIDHQLNFFLNHYEPSLRTDRTLGSHPILQKLDNLKDAGTLYGDIIYHKAPIVMRMLERQISEEKLQEGLRRYLLEWQYSSAEWSDLLGVLQSVAGTDLQNWNDVWVKGSGAPVVSLENDMILPDGDILGYASFLPAERGIEYLEENIGLIKEPLERAIGWQLLYNGVLHNKVSGESFIRTCLKHLPSEKNNLIVNRTLNFLTTIYTTYLSDNDMLSLRRETEEFFIKILSDKSRSIDKRPYFKTLLSIYSLPETDYYLCDLLIGEEIIEGISLSEEDLLSIACNIALRNPDQFGEMKRDIPQIVKNRDLLRRFEYVYPAISYDQTVRDSLFNALLDEKNRVNEVWVAEALRWLNHPLCRGNGLGYVLDILSEVEEIQVTGDIFFPANWLNAGLSGHNSKEAYITLTEFLDAHPYYPANLKLKILVHTDHLRRLHAE